MKAAASKAGYARQIAIRAVGHLLSTSATSARSRISGPRMLKVRPSQGSSRYSATKSTAALATVIAHNPFTGETSFDLGRLIPAEITSLELTAPCGDGPLGQGSGLRVQSSMGKDLSALGALVRDPAEAPEREEKMGLRVALIEIRLRNASTAPIYREMESSDDKD